MEITKKAFVDPDRAAAQEDAITLATNKTEMLIVQYINDEKSYSGKYVSSDLFKDCFPQFAESKEARCFYNECVHNSASFLANTLFHRLMDIKADTTTDKVVFLTGIPGAGKTWSVLATGVWPRELAAIYEGQLAQPEGKYANFDAAINAGYKVIVNAVHATPESALKNTITRFNNYGRGASIETMSNIQGNLPEGLNSIRDKYGDSVKLIIYDYRERDNPGRLNGWDNLDVLRSEGNYHAVKERLTAAVEQLRLEGKINETAYRQAIGKPAIRHDAGRMDGSERGGHEGNKQQSCLAEKNSQAAIIKGKGR